MDGIKDLLDKIGWGLVIVVVGASAGYGFYTQDKSILEQKASEINGINSQISTIKSKMSEIKRFEEQYAKKQRELQKIEEELQKKKVSLKNEIDLPALLIAIFKEAEQVGIIIEKVTPQEGEDRKELYSTRKISFSVEATFLQFFIFVDRLAKFQQLIGVSNFSLTTQANKKVQIGTSGRLSEKNLIAGSRTFQLIKIQMELSVYKVI